MSWRVAKSLLRLIDQVNAAYPARSKASDGTIGDAAHQTRQSDHNPRVVPALGTVPVVLAADITHDPVNGCDTYALATLLAISRDLRISYIISNRRITGPAHGWIWVGYTGTDPHTNHMHVSVIDTVLADDVSDWQIGSTIMTGLTPTDIKVAILGGPSSLTVDELAELIIDGHDPRSAAISGLPTGKNGKGISDVLAAIEALPTTGGGISDADRTLLTTVVESVDRLEATLARMAAAVPTPV